MKHITVEIALISVLIMCVFILMALVAALAINHWRMNELKRIGKRDVKRSLKKWMRK